MRLLTILAVTLLLGTACNNKQSGDATHVLASVGDRDLRMSDLEGMFPEGTTRSDSTTIIGTFVSRWVKDNLVMREAEQNVPSDVNIDKLVREYRTSLILNAYQQTLMANNLDTAVNEQELREFYEKNKELYMLETPIMRCLFVKVPNTAPNLKEFSEWWEEGRKDTRGKIIKYASDYANNALLIDSIWHRADRIALELPKGTIDPEELSTGEYRRKDDNFAYFLKILSVKNKRDAAPFSFVHDQASKFILHQRKQKLINDKREELYKREIEKNTVKIFNY